MDLILTISCIIILAFIGLFAIGAVVHRPRPDEYKPRPLPRYEPLLKGYP